MASDPIEQVDRKRSTHCSEGRHDKCKRAQMGQAWVESMGCRCQCHPSGVVPA